MYSVCMVQETNMAYSSIYLHFVRLFCFIVPLWIYFWSLLAIYMYSITCRICTLQGLEPTPLKYAGARGSLACSLID